MDAHKCCVQLELIIGGIRDSIETKIKNDKREFVKIEKRGVEIQNEALNVVLIMNGLPPSEHNSKLILDSIMLEYNRVISRNEPDLNQKDLQIIKFVQYWEKLSNLTGYYKIKNEIPKALFGEWFSHYDCKFMPSKKTLYQEESTSDISIEKYILNGWMPSQPFIGKFDLITTLGSCFADELLVYLKKHNYRTPESLLSNETKIGWKSGGTLPIISCPASLVNTFVLLQQFEWAFEDLQFSDDLWVGSRGTIATPNKELQQVTRTIFNNTKVFVVTLGLSEVWYRKDSGQVLWRAVPKEQYDPEIHAFKVASFKENYDNLEKIIKIIKSHVPNASIIFTLSPVPLRATFRPVSCITANSASKALLRASVDELLRNTTEKDVYYFPSYEIVKEYHNDSYLDDARHVKPDIINQIMRLFHKYYLTP